MEIDLKKVRKEIRKLKKLVTTEELNKVNVDAIENGDLRGFYTQLTGHFFSDRAYDLIVDTATLFYQDNGLGLTPRNKIIPPNFMTYPNSRNFTVLEVYMAYNHDKINHILKFLKSEIKQLNIK
jgi:hypothetical protein